MRIETLGKRRFAFDLAWNDNFGDDAKESLRDAYGEGTPVVYTLIEGKDGEEILGSARITGKLKGSIYPYAAALASTGRDGIYVARPAAGQLWYVVINSGQVVPGTDRSLDEADALDALDTLRSGYPELVIYTAGVEMLDGRDFTLDAAVASAKVKPMKRLATENPVVGLIVLGLVLAAVGYGGWYLFLRKEEVKVDSAAEQARLRQLYVQKAQGAVSTVPQDPAWVLNAFDVARGSFPESISGWSLEGVTCQPAACTANYALPKDVSGYALTPIWDRFGKETVSLMGDKRSLSVTRKLAQPKMLSYTEVDVFQPPKTGARVIDTIGRLGMLFDNVTVDGDYKTENLNESLQAPIGTAPLMRETFALRQDEQLTEIRLKGLASYLSYAQFVATSLSFSTGSGSITPAWRVEWVRVHGGEI